MYHWANAPRLDHKYLIDHSIAASADFFSDTVVEGSEIGKVGFELDKGFLVLHLFSY